MQRMRNYTRARMVETCVGLSYFFNYYNFFYFSPLGAILPYDAYLPVVCVHEMKSLKEERQCVDVTKQTTEQISLKVELG